MIRGNRRGGMVAREIRTLWSITARARAISAVDYAAVVQMGSDFGIPFRGKLVTYEDTTVADELVSIISTRRSVRTLSTPGWRRRPAATTQRSVAAR